MLPCYEKFLVTLFLHLLLEHSVEIVFKIKHMFFTDSEVNLLVSSKMYSYITLTKLLPMLGPRALTLLTAPNKEPENDGCARTKYHHHVNDFQEVINS